MERSAHIIVFKSISEAIPVSTTHVDALFTSFLSRLAKKVLRDLIKRILDSTPRSEWSPRKVRMSPCLQMILRRKICGQLSAESLVL